MHDVAAALAQLLCQRIGSPRYDLWFAGKTKFTCHDDHLAVGVANLFLQDWLHKTFDADIRAAAADVLGRPLPVRFVIDPELFQAARERETAACGGAAVPNATPPAAHPQASKKKPRRWRQLSDFVVGSCNRVAHAAAIGLVESPVDVPCPLVLHGPVGTGKTHLLEGIYAGLGRTQSDWRVVFATAEEFTNRFVQAMHQGKLVLSAKPSAIATRCCWTTCTSWRASRRPRKNSCTRSTRCCAAGKPVAVSCDCHPRLADALLPEMIDRLAGGAVWGLTTPDHATCAALLHAKAAKLGGGVPEAVLVFLADHLHGNVRELEGAIHSVVHLVRVTGRPLDVPLAREALGDVLRHSVRLVRLPDVEQAVCTVLGLASDALRGKQRDWLFAHPRMLAMYLARKHTAATYSEIGKHLGNRSHSTVVAGEKKVRQWLADNAALPLGGKRPVPVRDVVERVEREMLR